jgi:acetylornithine deacetylase/succinyl-diaminopimelate desuccinylase-like protein
MRGIPDNQGWAKDPIDVLQKLIQFDTTNPPGKERECIEWIDRLLMNAGYETEQYAAVEERPNLIARLEGGNETSPLLLYGHVDVVGADAENWTHNPFDAVVDEGYVWGRGALDMKGPLSMMISAAHHIAQTDYELSSDLVLLFFADEEAGGDVGAGYMVENHPEVFRGIDYAIGEFGGYSMNLGGSRVYPIQMNEKIVAWTQLTFSGSGGHGALPHPGGAMKDMGKAVTAITESTMPIHVTPTVDQMITKLADEVEGEMGAILRQLLNPETTEAALERLGDDAAIFRAILKNTANPTVVLSDEKENVIPTEVTLKLDCRLLPGQTATDLKKELREIIPNNIEYTFDTIEYQPFPTETDPDLFDLLADLLVEGDPDAIPFPFIVFGSTDARHLARVDVQSYGWTPMRLPDDLDFLDTIHGPDERIPVDAVYFGTTRMLRLLRQYSNKTIEDGLSHKETG